MEFHIRNYGTFWCDRELFAMILVATDYYGSEADYDGAMEAAKERWDELHELFMIRNPERVRRVTNWRGTVTQIRMQLV